MAGPPIVSLCDLDRGFLGKFVDAMMKLCVYVSLEPVEASWQHSQLNRHTGVWKPLSEETIKANQLADDHEITKGTIETTSAKNSTIRRAGFLPFRRTFGKEMELPDSIVPDAGGRTRPSETDEFSRASAVEG